MFDKFLPLFDYKAKLKLLVISKNFNKKILSSFRKDLDDVINYDPLALTYTYGNYDKVLIRSARLGKLKIVKFAILKGGVNGPLALYQSAIGGHIDVVEYLKTYDKKRQAIFGACLGYNIKTSKSYNNIKNVKVIINILLPIMRKPDIIASLTETLNYFQQNSEFNFLKDILYKYKSGNKRYLIDI